MDKVTESHGTETFIIGYKIVIEAHRDIEEFKANIHIGDKIRTIVGDTRTQLLHNVERYLAGYCRKNYNYDMIIESIGKND